MAQTPNLTAIADAIRALDGSTGLISGLDLPLRAASVSQGVRLTAEQLAAFAMTPARFESIPMAERQATMLTLLADVARLKEGSSEPVRGDEIAARLRALGGASPGDELPNEYEAVEHIYLAKAREFTTGARTYGAFCLEYEAIIDPYSSGTEYLINSTGVSSSFLYCYLRRTSATRNACRIGRVTASESFTGNLSSGRLRVFLKSFSSTLFQVYLGGALVHEVSNATHAGALGSDIRLNGTGVSGRYYKINSYEDEDLETLLHQWIPAKRKVDSVAGFYDLVSRSFTECGTAGPTI